MEVERPAYSPLVIDGLSYSDWEDDADHLRQLAAGSGRVTKKQVAHTEKLLASLQDELDAIDSVSPRLVGFDAVRVGCVRDLLFALRISLLETRRLLEARTAKRPAKSRKAMAST
ncbi:hypothetical protein PRN20_18350 [Devosia sp. ZB163]|uniref:hypothetical protein n=1 Tax=Devosia sp. ZB163 TaxID=3025938 RepID=UPI0023613F92|nr:hypothetical protein [Devosia sp. ZB163]MDC9825699.1 hypothetical protein [Devosia sp. ZB163]